MLKKLLVNAGWTAPGPTLLAHWMNWFGDSHYHPMNRYRSDSVSAINAQLDVMQFAGVDGVIVTWQGSNNTLGQTATLLMNELCVARKMSFCLLADPWLVGNKPGGEQIVIKELTGPVGITLLSSPAYLPETYFLDFTGGLFDSTVVEAALKPQFPNFNVLKRHTGYSWPEINNTIPILTQDNNNPAMKIPGLFYKFFDGGNPTSTGGIDWSTQSWGSGPSRSIEDQAGNTFWDCWNVTPKQSKYLALVTWNDYNERTAWEPFLSILANRRVM